MMDKGRITERRADGTVELAQEWMKNATLGEKVGFMMERLAEYEDTGLTPREASAARRAVHIAVMELPENLCPRGDKTKCVLLTVPTKQECDVCREHAILSKADYEAGIEELKREIEWIERAEDE